MFSFPFVPHFLCTSYVLSTVPAGTAGRPTLAGPERSHNMVTAHSTTTTKRRCYEAKCYCIASPLVITVNTQHTDCLSSPRLRDACAFCLFLSFVNVRIKQHQVLRGTYTSRTLLSVSSLVVHWNIPSFVLHVICNHHDGGNAAPRPAKDHGQKGRIQPPFFHCSVCQRPFNSSAILISYRIERSGVPVFIANVFMLQVVYENVRQERTCESVVGWAILSGESGAGTSAK